MIKTAQIVDDSSKDDEMGINNTAEIFFEDDDETDTFRLVTSVRGDVLNNLISIESPLGPYFGQALEELQLYDIDMKFKVSELLGYVEIVEA